MISILFLCKLTAILLLGVAALLLSRRLSAASRHLLCMATLGMTVLLPITLALPTLGQSQMITLVTSASSAIAVRHPSSLHLIAIGWIGGTLFVLLRFAFGASYVAWRVRKDKQADEFQSGGVPVRFADIATPVLWGWIRPTILMPTSSANWSAGRKQIALAHELSHYDRRDNWTTLIGIAAQAMYWFHPLVWWLAVEAEQQRELACDDRVLVRGASSLEYASLLVDIASQHSSPVRFGCAMFRNKNQLKGRLMHILHFRKPEPSRRNRFAVASAISIMLLGCLLIPATADQQKIYKIGGDVMAPKVLYKIEPDYAPQPKRDKVQGAVLLGLIISADGQPQEVQVIRSLNSDLDKNAVKAVSQWKFRPATKDGNPVPVEAKIEVNFRLK